MPNNGVVSPAGTAIPPSPRPEAKGLLLGADIAKQVITLAIAIITITMTFAEKLGVRTGDMVRIPLLLKISWVLFALSLIFSLWTLLSITGTLNTLDKGEEEKNPSRSNIDFPARLMMASFGIGFVLVFIAGFRLVSSQGSTTSKEASVPKQVVLVGINRGLTVPVNLVAVDSIKKPVPVDVLSVNTKDRSSLWRIRSQGSNIKNPKNSKK